MANAVERSLKGHQPPKLLPWVVGRGGGWPQASATQTRQKVLIFPALIPGAPSPRECPRCQLLCPRARVCVQVTVLTSGALTPCQRPAGVGGSNTRGGSHRGVVSQQDELLAPCWSLTLARPRPHCSPTSPGGCPTKTQTCVETSMQRDQPLGRTASTIQGAGAGLDVRLASSAAAPPAPGFPTWPSKSNFSSR